MAGESEFLALYGGGDLANASGLTNLGETMQGWAAMRCAQESIIAPLSPHAVMLRLQLLAGVDCRSLARRLEARPLANEVVGLGRSLLMGLSDLSPAASGRSPLGELRELPVLSSAGVTVPSTPGSLWLWLRDEDRGELALRVSDWLGAFKPWLRLEDMATTFVHRGGRDLSGYEDGTENPVGQAAWDAGFVQGQGAGLDGSSFVAVQRWRHDLARLQAFTETQKDDLIGRRRVSNEEFAQAPASAHVKRAAQESFSPEAFMLRRSMPWSQGDQAGLMFVAFGRTLDAFDAVLRRMVGLDDGVIDGLFQFTQPVDGGCYWCPPTKSSGERYTVDLSRFSL